MHFDLWKMFYFIIFSSSFYNTFHRNVRSVFLECMYDIAVSTKLAHYTEYVEEPFSILNGVTTVTRNF